MADSSDRSLEISIILNLLNEGKIDEAKKGLLDLGDASKSLSQKQSELGDGFNEAGKGAEKASGEGREMFRIYSDLDRLAPGLGEGLRAMVTGPLGAIGALLVGLNAAKSAWEDYDQKLEEILGEDLTSGIDKANALATAYKGIADAVAKANEQFNSAESIAQRAQKNIEAQLNFTKQLIDAEKQLALQRLESAKANGQISDAQYQSGKAAIEGEATIAGFEAEKKAIRDELTQKDNEAANLQAQADAAKRKADAFKLPESDDVAKASADALSAAAKTRRDQGEAENAKAQRFEDANVSAQSAGGLGALMTKGFWDFAGQQIMNHGLAVWNYQTGGQAIREQRGAAKSDTDIANSTDASAARISKLIKERDKAREDAAQAAGKATTAKDDAAWESDPKNAGSLAAKFNQTDTLEKISGASHEQSQMSELFKRITADLAIHGPGASAAMKDAAIALQSAVGMFKDLAATGEDMSRIKNQLAVMQRRISDLSHMQ